MNTSRKEIRFHKIFITESGKLEDAKSHKVPQNTTFNNNDDYNDYNFFYLDEVSEWLPFDKDEHLIDK